MLGFLWNWMSNIQKTVFFSVSRVLTFSSISTRIEDHPCTNELDDLESNKSSGVVPLTSTSQTYTIRPQPQTDLQVVGIGASGQVYSIDDDIVLKASRIFERPHSDAPESDHYRYASDTIFHVNLLEDERTVLQLLQKKPQTHIIEAVDTDRPEGIYLRKYRPLSPHIRSVPSLRYCEITDALSHIHGLGIVHADIRIENILFDDHDSAILCDFSASSPSGEPNLVWPDLPLPINGSSPNLSDMTDMFAMASLIFGMEHGVPPALSFQNGELALPGIRSGNGCLDQVIKKAWLRRYNRTSEMLDDLRSIDLHAAQHIEKTMIHQTPKEILQVRVKEWRDERTIKFGRVLNGILSEEQLTTLADCYGLDKDADMRFANYPMLS